MPKEEAAPGHCCVPRHNVRPEGGQGMGHGYLLKECLRIFLSMTLDPSPVPTPPHRQTLLLPRSCTRCFLPHNPALKPNQSPTCFVKTLLTIPDPSSFSDDLPLASYHTYIWHKANDLLMRSLLLCPLIASYIKNLFPSTRHCVGYRVSLWIHTINFSYIFLYPHNTDDVAGS